MMAPMSLLTCSALGAQLYFSDAGTGVIFRANPDGTGVTPVVDTGFTSWTMPIEVDPLGQRIYWAEVSNSTSSSRIRSATYTGGDIKTLVDNSDTGRILDLELDPTNRQLYWTDGTLNRIERIHLNGTGRENLTSSADGEPMPIEEVVGIALDLPNNAIYYTSDDSRGMVGRFDLITGSMSELVHGTSPCCSFGGIWDIELDADSGLLFFIDEDDSKLYSIGADGEGFTELNEPSGGSTPFGLELHEGSLFIAFANSGIVTSTQLETGDEEFEILSDGQDRPSGVAIDESPELLQFSISHRISSISITPTDVRLTIPPAVCRNVGVEYSPDLSPSSWIELGNFSPAEGDWVFIDPDPVRLARPSGYYRAFLRPVVP